MTDNHVQLERQRLEDTLDKALRELQLLAMVTRHAQRLVDEIHVGGASLTEAGERAYETLKTALRAWYQR